LLISQARYPEAEQLLKKALDNYIREKGENDFDVGSVRLRLGSLYTQLGRVKEAEPLLMQCLHNRQEKYGENHSRVGQVMKHLLTFYEEAGNLEKAAEAGEKALKITGIVVESNPLFQNKRSDLEASKFQEFIYGLATFIS
jgi:tetratricopeptide (TPR) repeat protein